MVAVSNWAWTGGARRNVSARTAQAISRSFMLGTVAALRDDDVNGV
jgi:hypothetical protein